MKYRGIVIILMAVALFATGMHSAAAQETVIYSFYYGTADGLYPYGGLVSDGAGNLYGTTYQGGAVGSPFGTYGTAFELSPATGGTWTEKIIYNFGSFSGDGINPIAALVFDGKGNLYGTTYSGGANNNSGTVFELSPGTGGVWTEKILYNFGATTTDGIQPAYGTLIFDAKGNIYGTNNAGGTNGVGTVWELVAGSGGSWTEKILYNFGASTTDGASPTAGVVFDAAGNLYGTTYAGGAYPYGTVFELVAGSGGTWTEKILHSFDKDSTDGAYPTAPVVFDPSGNLYGTTKYGGGGLGIVYELSPTAEGTWTEEILHSFTGGLTNGDGANPVAGMTFDAAGNLYGTTMGGGIPAVGMVFKMSRSASGWSEQVLYPFSALGSDGHAPYAGVIFDAAGNLYGTTTAGGSNSFGLYGAVFEIANVVTAAPQFSPPSGAYSSTQTVTISDATASSTIYYTINGGISPAQYKTPIKVSSSETITAYAISTSLAQSQPAVGNYQIGSVAATPWFSPPAGTYTAAQSVTIHDAAPGVTIYYTTNGTTPTTSSTVYTGPISVTSTKTIEALAVASGYSNSSVASAKYTITPITPPTEKVLYNFGATSADGGVPLASLAIDGKGNLYGTTKYGGPNEITYSGNTTTAGTAFEVSPATGGGWTEKVIYNFGASSSDGALPITNMILDSKGNLYGTTLAGGSFGLGTVFELSDSGGTWTEKILYSFGASLSDGKSPEGGLVFDSKGNLYGTTNIGGASDSTFGGGYGTVFELSPGSGGGAWTEQIIYNFSYLSQNDGYFPAAGLVFDASGNLYGTTADGGSAQDLQGGGTVFELSPAGASGWTEKVLYNFGGGSPQGYEIDGGVVLDASGNIYGTAHYGGNGFGIDGALFELSPGTGSTWTFQVLHSFGAYEGDGISPLAGLVFDSAGDLCGTTYSGGTNGYGTVFEMTPQTGGGWIESVVHNFALSSTDGASPSASLILDGAGNLYGTTAYGGSHGAGDTGTIGGTVFEIVSSTTVTNTTTTLTAAPNPSAYGQSVTFTATVKPQSGTGTPTGTVTFKNGTTTLGTGTLSGGVAHYSTTKLAVGTHSITAVYGGSTAFAGSTSSALSQVVDQASTTTTLVSSLNPSAFGESVTFTATVTPEFTGTPAGTITFKNGTATLGTKTLTAGVATFSSTTLTVGTHSITAVYSGGTSFLTSTSSAVSQVVGKASSTTAVVSSLNPSIFGESVTFTATVTSEFSGTPAGTVTFKNGTATLGTVTLSGGVAGYTTSTLAVGTHSITAVYNGNGSFTTSTSTAVSQVVDKASTSTALLSSANPSTVGQSVTFTATVTPQFTGTPGGSVTFKDGSTTLGSITLSAGVAKYSTATLAEGTHTITATYHGNPSFTTSSATLKQTVN